MFGYVRPVESELTTEQQQAFRACYCGVCRALGPIARFALRYECAFLALLYDGLTTPPPTKRLLCRGLPVRKETMALGDHQAYAAAINVLLAYEKLRDDVHDDHSLKARLGMIALFPAMRNVRRQYPALCAQVREQLTSLAALEAQNSRDVDATADCFGKLLQAAAAPGYDRQGALGRFFYDLGRWIYVIDALNDYEEDRKQRRYNVLHSHATLDAARDAMGFSLWHTLSQMEQSLQNLMPSQPTLGVCEHILYDVLPAHTLRALGQDEGGLDPEPLSSVGR